MQEVFNADYLFTRTVTQFALGAWLLLASSVIFFMQAGFGMLEAGNVQSKNTKNILIKNMLDSAMGALSFWAFGFAFAAGEKPDGDYNSFIGTTYFFLTNDFNQLYQFAFQFAFACTAATVVSGAMAERNRFGAYMTYTCFITAFVHPVVVYWLWSQNGWLSPHNSNNVLGGNGFIDYAGGCCVHMVGGFAGLMGSLVIGPRNHRFVTRDDGSFDPKWQGHSVVYTTLGAFILWFCWYPFNAGTVYQNLQKSDCHFKGTCPSIGEAGFCTGNLTRCPDTFLMTHIPNANNVAAKVRAAFRAMC
jgi:Amt family ammonium transporter